MEIPAYVQILMWGFGLAMLLGAIIHKTNFCTMGSVSDLVNMGDTSRLRAWLFAITTAMLGVLIMEGTGAVDLSMTMPPYRSSNFDWLRYILGGTMFGIGMTLGSGCINKTLIRVGGGNLKSLLVLFLGGIMAYLMTMTNFYHYAFHLWINPTAIELSNFDINSQQLSAVIAGIAGVSDTGLFHYSVGGIVVAALLFWIFKSSGFRGNRDNVLGGLGVGLLVVAAWYLTGGPLGQEAIEEVSFMDEPPRGVGVMSLTFVNPMGETLNFIAHPTQISLFTFGVSILLGAIFGSFVYAIFTRRFHFEWFSSWKDFFRHAIGGILMGTGGVLAMGCTIGQGVTGMSTMALGSVLAFGTFIFGSALTMKIEYYRMVYEEKATFMAALLSTLVDMRLLPKGARRLDPA